MELVHLFNISLKETFKSVGAAFFGVQSEKIGKEISLKEN